MKKFFSLIILLALFINIHKTEAQNYIGLGAVYSIPVIDFADINGQSVGGALVYESRRYCNLWYGLRFEYIDFEVNPGQCGGLL